MSNKKYQYWVMMPVLGLLLMSPKEIEVKYGRHIASDNEPAPVAEVKPEVKPSVESKTPKIDALLSSAEIPAKQNPLNLNSDMLKEDISSLLSRVSKAEEFDKKTVKKPELDKLREEIKASAIELRQVENSLKDLMNPEEEHDIPSRVQEAKIRLEASLKDLEETEVLVANRPAETPATEAKPVVAESKPDVVERSPSVVESETKEEPKKEEDKKEEKDPILCALEEQNKLLQQQLQGFVQQQSMIMQQLLSMSQMMMMQNMYRTPDTFNYKEAYQYHQPQVAGNWVYYPQGLQPIQPGQQAPGQQGQADIFGLNNMSQMGGMGSHGLQQPPMMNQMPGQWGLGSQFIHTPGNFGMSPQVPGSNFSMETQGFNFSTPAVTGLGIGPITNT